MRDHRILAEQLAQHTVRLQHTRPGTVLQPGLALVDPAGQQRRQQYHQQQLCELKQDGENEIGVSHHTNTNKTISVTKV